MMHLETRYDVIQDPTDCWTVWDNVLREPAMDGVGPLAGLSLESAETSCRALNCSELSGGGIRKRLERTKPSTRILRRGRPRRLENAREALPHIFRRHP